MPDHHIIAAGLLEVAVSRSQFSLLCRQGGHETIYSVDMEEFLLALGRYHLPL